MSGYSALQSFTSRQCCNVANNKEINPKNDHWDVKFGRTDHAVLFVSSLDLKEFVNWRSERNQVTSPFWSKPSTSVHRPDEQRSTTSLVYGIIFSVRDCTTSAIALSWRVHPGVVSVCESWCGFSNPEFTGKMRHARGRLKRSKDLLLWTLHSSARPIKSFWVCIRPITSLKEQFGSECRALEMWGHQAATRAWRGTIANNFMQECLKKLEMSS